MGAKITDNKSWLVLERDTSKLECILLKEATNVHGPSSVSLGSLLKCSWQQGVSP